MGDFDVTNTCMEHPEHVFSGCVTHALLNIGVEIQIPTKHHIIQEQMLLGASNNLPDASLLKVGAGVYRCGEVKDMVLCPFSLFFGRS